MFVCVLPYFFFLFFSSFFKFPESDFPHTKRCGLVPLNIKRSWPLNSDTSLNCEGPLLTWISFVLLFLFFFFFFSRNTVWPLPSLGFPPADSTNLGLKIVFTFPTVDSQLWVPTPGENIVFHLQLVEFVDVKGHLWSGTLYSDFRLLGAGWRT